MKLKQDVESSWKCPFVSVSEEEGEAQHAFCNVKEEGKPEKSVWYWEILSSVIV